MATSPPYPAGTLHPPLTSAEKAAMIAYLGSIYTDAQDAATLAQMAAWINSSKSSDQQDGIDDYDATVRGGRVHIPDPKDVTTTKTPANWTAAIISFFEILTSKEFWIRAAEFMVGAAMVGIGVAHLTGNHNVLSKAAGAVLK